MPTVAAAYPACQPSDHYGYWVDDDGNRQRIARSQKGHFWANAMELWMAEIETAYGFTSHIYDSPDGRERVIELLGPDSPGEYVRVIPKWTLADPYLQQTCNDTILWADRMGREYTGEYRDNERGDPIVPPQFRQE